MIDLQREKGKAISVTLMVIAIELFMAVITSRLTLNFLTLLLVSFTQILLPVAALFHVYFTIPDWFDELSEKIKLYIIQFVGKDLDRRRKGMQFPGLGPILFNLMKTIWQILTFLFFALVFIPILVILDVLLVLKNKTSQKWG